MFLHSLLAEQLLRRAVLFSGLSPPPQWDPTTCPRTPHPAASSHRPAPGPLQVGLDTGLATHSLNEASGRLGYRGKVMNRASRVAGKAAAGQVVCTDACWRGCLEGGSSRGSGGGDGDGDGGDGETSECESAIGGLVGISLGKVALKGVSAPVELIQCMRG